MRSVAGAPAGTARTAGRDWLRQALQESRARTLAQFDAYELGLRGSGLDVPLSPDLNPPLWELGHVGWFQDWWIARSRERARGVDGNPDHERLPSRLKGADDLYDSSRVAHDTRWSLPLPDAKATRDYLRDGLEETLALLAQSAEDDASLYFFRLVLFHEDMHAEASVYMAQSLGIALPEDVAFPAKRKPLAPSPALRLAGTEWRLGQSESTPGFAFDNEIGQQVESLAPFEIDAAPVSWARYLPFVEATGSDPPRYLRFGRGQWEQQRFGRWEALDPASPAIHVSLHEAQAWCRWAGRRLPTESQWEYAAATRGDFAWGDAWEWTASAFMPYAGFRAHPYRDYSAPWFATRQVLRGACAATAPRMAHTRYRNFFVAERNDIFAGFRSCAA